MKLATVNPLDFSNLPTLLHKDVSLNCPLFIMLCATITENVSATYATRNRPIQMFQACGPSASSVFSLESSSSAFPFSDQGDVFQSFVPNSMESQCTLNQLDLALSQTTNAQYGFQDGMASTNLQQVILGLQNFVVHGT
jgi:hypothetical protein